MGLFGGSSKSSSSAITTNQDNRGVADAQGVVATGDGKAVRDNGVINYTGITSSPGAHVEISNTDHGAIGAAFQFADNSAQASMLSVKNALGVSEGVFNKATEAVDKAYEEAKGGATVLQNISMAALVAAAFIVYSITKGKHA